MKTNLFGRTGLGLLLLIAIATAPLSAQEESKPKAKPKADKQTEKESDSDKSSLLAIVGGDIHTVTGAVIRQGTVLVQDGKILDVGQSITVPDDATVIDATGKTITPGFVAISMRGVGLRGAPGQRAKLADALDPYDRNIKYSLGIGITSGCIEMTTGRGRRGRRGTPDLPDRRDPLHGRRDLALQRGPRLVRRAEHARRRPDGRRAADRRRLVRRRLPRPGPRHAPARRRLRVRPTVRGGRRRRRAGA